jgi:nucleotidyltransferase substrate binding protein (TIGR01987 family)
MDGIDYSPLQKAIASLGRAIDRSVPAPQDEELRDAVIQRFEYTFELCWKMLKRRLEQDMPTPSEVDLLSFRELIREGAERGLVGEVERWMFYRDQRNITAHTYDQGKAAQVHAAALRFIEDARRLLGRLTGGRSC